MAVRGGLFLRLRCGGRRLSLFARGTWSRCNHLVSSCILSYFKYASLRKELCKFDKDSMQSVVILLFLVACNATLLVSLPTGWIFPSKHTLIISCRRLVHPLAVLIRDHSQTNASLAGASSVSEIICIVMCSLLATLLSVAAVPARRQCPKPGTSLSLPRDIRLG